MDAFVKEPRFKWQDACALVATLVAFEAMSEMAIGLRLFFLLVCAVCLPISFFSHRNWPLVVRWLGSILVVVFLSYVGLSAWKGSRPKLVREVFLEWEQPAPMDFGVALSGHQLNAVARDKTTGEEVRGTYLYSPTFGATLPSGMDTLSVEFTPEDQAKFKLVKNTAVVLVKDVMLKQKTSLSSRPSTFAHLPSSLKQAAGPVSVNNAPNGIAISGGNVFNPTVNNMTTPARRIEGQEESDLISCLSENQE